MSAECGYEIAIMSLVLFTRPLLSHTSLFLILTMVLIPRKSKEWFTTVLFSIKFKYGVPNYSP